MTHVRKRHDCPAEHCYGIEAADVPALSLENELNKYKNKPLKPEDLFSNITIADEKTEIKKNVWFV